MRRRDPESIGLLYDRYGRAAYNLALRILNDADAAESAVAEAMLKCWNRIASFRETRGCALGIWLLTTTYANAIGQRRGLSAREVDLLPGPHVLERGELFEDWSSFVNRDNVEDIFLAFGRLDPEEVKLLDLSFFDGLNPAELTARMGRTQADVDQLIESALSKLAGDEEQ